MVSSSHDVDRSSSSSSSLSSSISSSSSLSSSSFLHKTKDLARKKALLSVKHEIISLVRNEAASSTSTSPILSALNPPPSSPSSSPSSSSSSFSTSSTSSSTSALGKLDLNQLSQWLLPLAKSQDPFFSPPSSPPSEFYLPAPSSSSSSSSTSTSTSTSSSSTFSSSSTSSSAAANSSLASSLASTSLTSSRVRSSSSSTVSLATSPVSSPTSQDFSQDGFVTMTDFLTPPITSSDLLMMKDREEKEEEEEEDNAEEDDEEEEEDEEVQLKGEEMEEDFEELPLSPTSPWSSSSPALSPLSPLNYIAPSQIIGSAPAPQGMVEALLSLRSFAPTDMRLDSAPRPCPSSPLSSTSSTCAFVDAEAEKEYLQATKFLIQARGATVLSLLDRRGYGIVHYAALKEFTSVLEYLRDGGFDGCLHLLDFFGNNSMLTATAHGRLEAVRILIGAGVDGNHRNSEGKNALGIACETRNEKMVSLLCSELPNLNLNERDSQGKSLLHYVCAQGHHEIAEILVRSGADPLLKDHTGTNALLTAVMLDKLASLELLCEDRAILDASDRLGRTPLHWAATLGNLEAAMFLVKAGAKLEQRDKKGRTPYLSAVFARNPEIMSFLKQKKVNTEVEDYEGRS